MQDSKMNSRVKKILLRICSEDKYVTISAVAKELGVSAKTILRELYDVEQWLASKGCSLSKKTGAGIKVNGSSDRKTIILDILQGEKEENLYSPKERQIVIISELLQNQEAVKLYNFTSILKVTEGTISNDLDKVEQWFAKQTIKLIRKPGLGVYIEGQENDIRKAMARFIYENVEEDQLLGVIRNSLMNSTDQSNDIETKTRRRLLNLIDKEVIYKLESSIHAAEGKIGHTLADSAHVGLIVHLALAVQRIKKNEEITIDEEFLQELKKYPEYLVAADMAANIGKSFAIEVPKSEIGYITMHIRGSKNRNDYEKDNGKIIGNFELVKISKEMIKIAELETGCLLAQNKNLLIGLVNHLGPSISRLKMNMDIRNPFLEEIRSSYPELITLSRKCATVIEKQLEIKMPDSEIAYIAMHLGAAIETGVKLPKPVYRCAIACPTGIGTSRLLATKIGKEYDNIQVVEIISTIHIDETRLSKQKIDFIISTVTIEYCSIPVVIVNPLLFEEDKNRINHQMKLLVDKIHFYPSMNDDGIKFKERLISLQSYGKAILEILENFFLVKDDTARTIEEIIQGVSSLVGSSHEMTRKLAYALQEREEKGGTFITGHGFVLLHCRTNAVKKLYFGVVQIGNEIVAVNGKNRSEAIKMGIIMLAPGNTSENAMETISYISKILIERPEFIRVLQEGTEQKAAVEISNALEEFYHSKKKNLMGE
ncbi:mannitol operon transcriptional antiterminator [Sporomusaceae bacterium BoRhaA]|uniref:BglG family transcription antiterminator n=1 Tax=Pelorhabdus rhamnosifermentans TaxID=2772457 RepID=UPI001C06293E|nr:BglG family transcription antiterminator [Pelorhabdus rhamnosifermentans]MBU2704179.1 mannitol operon transcriptional antiterminator [Pelorhabdus rhamnosifermentans]